MKETHGSSGGGGYRGRIHTFFTPYRVTLFVRFIYVRRATATFLFVLGYSLLAALDAAVATPPAFLFFCGGAALLVGGSTAEEPVEA